MGDMTGNDLCRTRFYCLTEGGESCTAPQVPEEYNRLRMLDLIMEELEA